MKVFVSSYLNDITLFCLLQSFRLLESEEAMKELGLTQHQLRFTSTVTMEISEPSHVVLDRLHTHLERYVVRLASIPRASFCLKNYGTT
jgi:hypothetical protein